MRSHTKLILAASLLATATTVAVAADLPSRRAPPVYVPPAIPEFDTDFYLPPQSVVAAKKPGELIADRRVHVAALSVIPINVDAWQISYRSTNTRGEPIPGPGSGRGRGWTKCGRLPSAGPASFAGPICRRPRGS